MRFRIVVIVMCLLGLQQISLKAQLVDNFNQYSWEQKDSIIETLYRGGAHHVVSLMIKQAYDEEVAKPSPEPDAMAAFNMWQGVRLLSENNIEEATRHFQQAVDLYEENPGIRKIRYQDALINLSDIYQEVGDPLASLEQMQKVLSYMAEDTTSDPANHLSTLMQGVDVAISAGNVQLAEEYGREALSLSQHTYGNQSDEYFQSLCKLGEIYAVRGEVRRASNLILQAYDLAKDYLPRNHFNRVYYGNQAVDILLSLGRYSAAEEVFMEVVEFYEDFPNFQKDISYPIILDKMGSFYQDQGDLDKAYEYYERANILFELRLENTDPQYIQSQSNVANILRMQGKFLEAELYYLTALRYAGEAFGENSWSEGYLRDNLASMYLEMNKYEESLEQRLLANEIVEVNLGPNHPEFAVSSLNIGQTYMNMGNDSLARDYMTTAYVKLDQIYGPNHMRVYTAAYSLARYYTDSDVSLALDYFQRASNFVAFHLNNISPLLPMTERENMRQQFQLFISQYLSYAYEHRDRHPTGINAAQNFLLGVKAANDRPDIVTTLALLKNPDTDQRKAFVAWQNLRTTIRKASEKTIAERKADGEDLEPLLNELRAIERQILPVYSRNILDYSASDLDVSQLKAKLNAGEALVDMIRIHWYDFEKDSLLGDHTYLGFITGAASTYTEVVKITLNRNVLGIQQLRNQAAYSQQIWNPLSTHLMDYDLVYFAPDDLLHEVSFAALATNEGGLVWDQLETVVLTSPLDLLKSSSGSAVVDNVAFAGSPDLTWSYNDTLESTLPNDFRIPAEYITSYSLRQQVRFNNPAGSSQEVTQLSQMFTRKKKNVTLLKDAESNKSNIYQVCQSNGLVHLSVPGYFLDLDGYIVDTTREGTFLTSKWLKSGLALSGATNAWNSDTILDTQKDDGYLTSLEIATMDLQHVELLVLNGLNPGQMENGLAFNQLVRTLKLAGVDQALVSLWQVSLEDRLTFYERYYKYLVKGMSPREALARTQKKLRKKYDPRVWAGYTLY